MDSLHVLLVQLIRSLIIWAVWHTVVVRVRGRHHTAYHMTAECPWQLKFWLNPRCLDLLRKEPLQLPAYAKALAIPLALLQFVLCSTPRTARRLPYSDLG